MSASMSISTNQRPKQRQRPSATGPVRPSLSGDDAPTLKRGDSSTTTKTTRNQNAPTRTRKNTMQATVMTRSTSANESTADMFTAKSRQTHVSKGIQAQTRSTRENTRDIPSPTLTRSSSNTRTSNDVRTRSLSRAHANPIGRTNSKTRASSSQKSKALLPLENFV